MAKKKNLIMSNEMTLQKIEPITTTQEELWKNYDSGKSQLLLGCAGTGKTICAIYKALEEIKEKGEYKRIVIVRSAVPSRDIGFLKGDETEKGAVYELPYKKIFSELYQQDDAYVKMIESDSVRFVLTSFVRGLTIDNAIVIVDELQNMTAHEIDSVITRIGQNSKIVICGDIMQSDITKASEKNIDKFINVLERMNNRFDFNYFGIDDIVRSDLVADYIRTKTEMYKHGF